MKTFLRLEQCLLPPVEIIRWNGGNLIIETSTTIQKVAHYAKNAVMFTGLLAVSPLTLAYDYLTQKQITPRPPAPDIAPAPPNWPPEQRGFACSLFQTSGLGTKWSATPGLAGRCDWDDWMDDPKHVAHPPGFDYKDFFTDVISNPGPYIDMLKAQNVTAHRFSLEWSVIQPSRDTLDHRAIALYKNFIEKLLAAGITPSVTLSHFVVPKWFYEQGNFQNLENVDAYVYFAIGAMNLFPEVKDWWSFNELGVKAFQQTREVYPTDVPEGSSLSKRVYAAGIATRNMLIAHCKLTQAAARLHPDKKVGVTHQWMKFDMATGNVLERLFRYFFEKFGFYPVYGFFEEGRFSFQFPFMANIQFEIPKEEFEANRRFLARLGVQAYPKAMIKMGMNHGQQYPCAPGSFQNSMFTFGAVCEEGGTLMRFGPRWKAEAIDEILDEAYALTDEVYITEYGSDARVFQWNRKGFELNEAAQAENLRQLTERIKNYVLTRGRTLKGIFAWSDLTQQMEWENGQECQLALIHPVRNALRQLVDWIPIPGSRYLAWVYGGEAAPANQEIA